MFWICQIYFPAELPTYIHIFGGKKICKSVWTIISQKIFGETRLNL